jgi:hypothetical protein
MESRQLNWSVGASAFLQIMYNRLLFYCPQLAVDVIFAAVSNQCPQRPPTGKLFPPLNVAVERSCEVVEKRRFFEEAQNCKRNFI